MRNFIKQLIVDWKRKKEVKKDIKRFNDREKESIPLFVQYALEQLKLKNLVNLINFNEAKNQIVNRALELFDKSGDFAKAIIDGFEYVLRLSDHNNSNSGNEEV